MLRLNLSLTLKIFVVLTLGALCTAHISPANADTSKDANNNKVAQKAREPLPLRKSGRVKFPPLNLEKLTVDLQSIPERRLQFPKDSSCGGLIICSHVRTNFNDDNSEEPTAKAQGLVKIPAGKFVWFAPSVYFFQHPHALDQLPAEAFDGLLFRFTAVDDADDGKADAAFSALSRFSGIKVLDLDNSEISDKGLQYMGKLSKLEYMSAARTQLNGSFMKSCFNPKLKHINMDGTMLEPQYVRYFNNFPDLRYLRLSYTHIGSDSVGSLAAAKSLSILDIAETRELDDKIIEPILKIKTLLWVKDKGTKVTTKGQQRMEAAGIYVEPPSDFSTQKLTPEQAKYLKGITRKQSKRTHELQDLFRPLSRGRGL